METFNGNIVKVRALLKEELEYVETRNREIIEELYRLAPELGEMEKALRKTSPEPPFFTASQGRIHARPLFFQIVVYLTDSDESRSGYKLAKMR